MDRVFDSIRDAWCVETAYLRGGSHGRPHGQCAVTALLVQSMWGGVILRAPVVGSGSHYWNQIEGMGEVDLTRDQFAPDVDIPRGQPVEREKLLRDAHTTERYNVLVTRFNAAMVDWPDRQ